MTYLETIKRTQPKRALPPTASRNLAAARTNKPTCLPGYGPQDSWETLAVARYRAYTNSRFGLRRSDSEPDLLNRRPPDFAAAAKYRRARSLNASGGQPLSHVAHKAWQHAAGAQPSEGSAKEL